MALKSQDDDDELGDPEIDSETEAEEQALWIATRKNDPAARKELVSRYTGFVHAVAVGVFRNTNIAYVDYRDLVQLGMVGLLESMHSYEADGRATFRTYAAKRIRGAMLDGLEHVSELHAQSIFRKRIRAKRAQSLQDHARESAGSELFMQMIEVALGLAVGHMIEGTAMFAAPEAVAPEESGEIHPGELRRTLLSMRALVARLSEPGGEIIRRHYFDGMQFAAIAGLLGISKSRVSQLHARAIEELREKYRSRNGLSLEL